MREIQMINTEFSTDQLDRLIFAIEGRIKQRSVIDRPYTKQEIADFLNVKPRTIENLVKIGSITPRHLPGLSIPYYFPSDITSKLKES